MAATGPKHRYSPYSPATIIAVASILGETDSGLTNKEIEKLLHSCGIRDPRLAAEQRDPMVRKGLAYVSMSKRERIEQALIRNQSTTQTGNALLAFLRAAMEPQRYVDEPQLFQERQHRLSETLAFVGLRITDKGKVARAQRATTLTEAAQLAGRLKYELGRRATHADVLRYCTEEVLAKNTFHAALEAVKGVGDRLRTMTGLTEDGAELARQALACGQGQQLVAINPLQTPSEKSEQTGLMNVIIGVFSMYRNPIAHDAKIVRQTTRPITEDELLEMFTTLSMIHHKLDAATSAWTHRARSPSSIL